jgi:hypothetical protein
MQIVAYFVVSGHLIWNGGHILAPGFFQLDILIFDLNTANDVV